MNNQENPQGLAACRACWEKNPEVPFADFWSGWKAKTAKPIIPDGFKLVPVEPTCDQLCAGVKTSGVIEIYKTMVAAAPVPPQVEAQPVAWIKADVAKTLTKNECCYAFGSQNPKGSLIPLFTHSDAGEVERLRDKLAKRDALIAREADSYQAHANDVTIAKHNRDWYQSRADDLRAVLSATKEGKGDE